MQPPELGGDLGQQLDPASPDQQQHQVARAAADSIGKHLLRDAPPRLEGQRGFARMRISSGTARRWVAVSRAVTHVSSESSRSAMESAASAYRRAVLRGVGMGWVAA